MENIPNSLQWRKVRSLQGSHNFINIDQSEDDDNVTNPSIDVLPYAAVQGGYKSPDILKKKTKRRKKTAQSTLTRQETIINSPINSKQLQISDVLKGVSKAVFTYTQQTLKALLNGSSPPVTKNAKIVIKPNSKFVTKRLLDTNKSLRAKDKKDELLKGDGRFANDLRLR